MTKLPLAGMGRIIPTELHEEMEHSYLEYAMSVIVGRALPDVRDGLKPVHRRIVFAMHELGLTPDRPFRKCARVVGDVLGKYHPHGDQAVYDALVRMVQDFSSRYPLLAGHGNFGSVDNDPPAAMRYTETRLSPVATGAVLADIDQAIIDFSPNFDNSQQEPTVLPVQLPVLLLNGCSGIAVGMATNIPPHNLGEVVDGLIALIDNPGLEDHVLWRLIPGPDFPTGGVILSSDGTQSAYHSGRGLIPVQGVSHLETLRSEKRRSRSRTAIIVTELPFQVNKAAWIEKIASLVNQGRIEGISDLRDESDRTGMRVVIELKRDTDPQAILDILYRTTPLQSNFGAIFLALVDNKPVQLSLRQILEEFLSFRETTLIRQYTHELEESSQRLDVLAGLRTALANIDSVIDILRSAPDGSTAKAQLQVRLDLTPPQADAILAMPLRRITGLEQTKLEQEYDALLTRIQELETLLNDRRERSKAMKKELRRLKKQFSDRRRTRILEPIPPLFLSPVVEIPPAIEADLLSLDTPAPVKEIPAPAAEIIASTPVATVSKAPKAKQAPLSLFTPQTPAEDAVLSLTAQNKIAWHSPTDHVDDQSPLIFVTPVQNQETLWLMTDQGKVYGVAVKEIPPLSLTRLPLVSFLPKAAQAETIVSQFFAPDTFSERDLVLLTEQGRIKRLGMAELADCGSRGLSLIKLKEDDRLQFVIPLATDQAETQNLVLATSSGRLLRLPLQDSYFPRLSRTAQGQQAFRVRSGESLVGGLVLNPKENLYLLTQWGWGKALPLEAIRLAKLEDLGTTVIQFMSKNDHLVGLFSSQGSGEILIRTTQDRWLTLAPHQFTEQGKDGPGDRLLELMPEEQVNWAWSPNCNNHFR